MKLSFDNMTIVMNIFNIGKQPSDIFDELQEVNVYKNCLANTFKD